jgi:hypothetical protein
LVLVAHDLNPHSYGLLKKAGLAPRAFKIGRREFITEESAAAWRALMDGRSMGEDARG